MPDTTNQAADSSEVHDDRGNISIEDPDDETAECDDSELPELLTR